MNDDGNGAVYISAGDDCPSWPHSRYARGGVIEGTSVTVGPRPSDLQEQEPQPINEEDPEL